MNSNCTVFPSANICGAWCSCYEKAHRQGVTLKLQGADGIELEADETKLKQIFYNLIGNALKFTPEGGTVTISADRGAFENTIQICVEDTGIGIKAEDLPRLFQKFTQLESAISKKYEGTGLGLALTKSLVELHGGPLASRASRDAGAASPSLCRSDMNRQPLSATIVAPTNSIPGDIMAERVLIVEDNEFSNPSRHHQGCPRRAESMIC